MLIVFSCLEAEPAAGVPCGLSSILIYI